ncbi:hypothetical protein G5V59_15550 [Nocardioides sp. W3-2-3]|uniref:hypothetical protein n=1 Tax=Nocardioides convexus TaxID=2712224 RepID=UPI0024184E3D|nr:hypothetical protein [Nocardioides convexus]NHA00856.1 hypothetical protein [Nocardioides convexus]
MKTAALAALALVGAASSTLVATPSASANAEDGIKNVIYLLGDGMGRTQVSAARQRYYGADGETQHGEAWARPVRSRRTPCRRTRASPVRPTSRRTTSPTPPPRPPRGPRA